MTFSNGQMSPKSVTNHGTANIDGTRSFCLKKVAMAGSQKRRSELKSPKRWWRYLFTLCVVKYSGIKFLVTCNSTDAASPDTSCGNTDMMMAAIVSAPCLYSPPSGIISSHDFRSIFKSSR